MKPWTKCILKLKTTKNWEKASSISPALTHIISLKPHKITNFLNSEESLLIFSERTANTNNQLYSLKKTKCTEMPLILPSSLITLKSLKIYWNSSSKEKRRNSSLRLFTHVMNTLDLTWSLNTLGDSECTSLLCPIWFNWSHNSKPELKSYTRKTKTEKRKKSNKQKKRWTNHSISLLMIWIWWCQDLSQCWQEDLCTTLCRQTKWCQDHMEVNQDHTDQLTESHFDWSSISSTLSMNLKKI